MWQTKGIAENFTESIIAVYSKKKDLTDWIKSTTIKNIDCCNSRRPLAGVSSAEKIHVHFPVIYDIPDDLLGELHDGDILHLYPSGVVRRVWDIKSNQNLLFITEYCNSHCSMCPQPQLPVEHSEEVLRILSCISKETLKEVCISGGEPTTSKNILMILQQLKQFPFVKPIMLTNGRNFCNLQFTKHIIDASPRNMVYAIPLYSSVSYIHDEIVGVKGAFEETIKGIYNLTKFRVPIEIRVVLTKQTIVSLTELANYIGWDLPMVVHVAFMGMEVHGRADENQCLVWIEPRDYMNDLLLAVQILADRNINVSIYNLPLCLLPKKLWKYSCRSISEWKQKYIAECDNCEKQNECGGFFATSTIIPEGIHPIKTV